MSRDRTASLLGFDNIECPFCKSKSFSFKRPEISSDKALVIISANCSDCNGQYTINYKAYEIKYETTKNKSIEFETVRLK